MGYAYAGEQHRPAVTGSRGMVSSAHPMASLAGLRTLMDGGNAIDAAVAVAATIGATEIGMSGMGGVGWMQIYHAVSDTHVCLDYQGVSPAAVDRDRYDDPAELHHGMMATSVPGSPGGWCAALDRFGTMDRAAVFRPVIELLEQGHPLTRRAAGLIGTYERLIREYPASVDAYFVDGEPPRPGHLIRQPDLANSFRMLVEGGPEVFYQGELGDTIAAFCQANGGVLAKEDLEAFEVAWVDPISVTYRGYEVFGPPPPSSAVQWLQTLKLLEGFDVAAMGHNSVDYLHTLIEVERLAITDRIHYNVQPGAPIAELLSDAYCADRRRLVDPAKANSIVGERFARTMTYDVLKPGDPGLRESTTHFNVADAEGNVVSCTQSLGGFGCGVVVPGTGILLNDFLYWFDLDADSPNVIGPRKKVEMCLSPGIIMRDGRIFASIGTPGSHGIMETTPQFMANLMDFEMTVQAAVEAPRVRPQELRRVIAERRIPADVLDGLGARGHVIDRQDDYSMVFGGAQGIMVDPDNGTFTGGADPRRDGYAMGW